MFTNWLRSYRYRSISVLGILILALALPASAAAQDQNCSDFGGDQEKAQDVLDQDPDDPNGLDRDKDGQACDDLVAGSSGSDSGSSDSADDESQSSLADTGLDAWLFGAAGIACMAGALLLRRRQT